MIRRGKIALRAVERGDLPQFMEWRNLPGFRKYFREYREINSDMQNDWFQSIVLNSRNTVMFSILDGDTGALIGCCGLCYIDWIHRNAELSLYSGVENSYIDSYGYADDACRCLLDFGFRQMNLHRIWAEIYQFDTEKEKLFRRSGFRQDAVLREHHFHDGKWYNSLVWSILEDEFTF